MCLNRISPHLNVRRGKVIQFKLVFLAFADLKIGTKFLSSLDNITGQILMVFLCKVL